MRAKKSTKASLCLLLRRQTKSSARHGFIRSRDERRLRQRLFRAFDYLSDVLQQIESFFVSSRKGIIALTGEMNRGRADWREACKPPVSDKTTGTPVVNRRSNKIPQ
jgi:hypothetical protein